MKHENKFKRKGKKVLPVYKDKKPCKRFEGKRQKIALTPKPIGEREKSLKSFEKWRTREKQSLFLKTTNMIFDQSKIRFDWSKMPSIDLEPIEQRSKRSSANQNFNCIFDRLKNRFNWSKILKTQIFEKQSKFLQKLLKALKFRNKMHEYEIKCFFFLKKKKLVLNPVFPKWRFSINSS